MGPVFLFVFDRLNIDHYLTTRSSIDGKFHAQHRYILIPSYPTHASTEFLVLQLHIFVLVPYFATAAQPSLESVNSGLKVHV